MKSEEAMKKKIKKQSEGNVVYLIYGQTMLLYMLWFVCVSGCFLINIPPSINRDYIRGATQQEI